MKTIHSKKMAYDCNDSSIRSYLAGIIEIFLTNPINCVNIDFLESITDSNQDYLKNIFYRSLKHFPNYNICGSSL